MFGIGAHHIRVILLNQIHGRIQIWTAVLMFKLRRLQLMQGYLARGSLKPGRFTLCKTLKPKAHGSSSASVAASITAELGS